MEELEIGDYINDINSYHLHMFDKHDVTTKKLDVIVEKAGKVDANYAAQIEGYCSLLGEYGKKFETVCAMLALDLIRVIPVIGALKYLDEIGTLFKNADKVSVVARSTDGAGVLAKHADEAGAWLHGGKVFRYSDETAEAVASGEKLLKESGTIYESFADMMSPEDAKRYLDFLENGSREGLTSAELADALLVSQKVEYEDVWDLRNPCDVLESGSKGGSDVVQSKFNKLLNSDYYKNNPGYDCSEIATDFYDTAGQQGKIYRIEGKDGVINGYEYGKVYDFEYHEVYSDGVYIYDPRYQNTPVLKDDYFRALKEINPDGFDVFTIQ